MRGNSSCACHSSSSVNPRSLANTGRPSFSPGGNRTSRDTEIQQRDDDDEEEPKERGIPVAATGGVGRGRAPDQCAVGGGQHHQPTTTRGVHETVKGAMADGHERARGRDQVARGGFHLVLMDIQLPVMNGLDATKEIRRMERLNSIGVFSSSASSHAPAAPSSEDESSKQEDRLQNLERFKSPVIIVALTASSLQSDRHEALAAGCNDFLTKVRNPFMFFPPFFSLFSSLHSLLFLRLVFPLLFCFDDD